MEQSEKGAPMNFFIEGLQGSGKSTLVKRMGQKHPECEILCEGAYSSVELAWCAYITIESYRELLDRFG